MAPKVENVDVREAPVMGMIRNVAETDVPKLGWWVADNVRMQDRRVKNALGWDLFAPAAAGDGTPVLLIVPQGDNQGNDRMIVATGAKFYKLLGGGLGMTALGMPAGVSNFGAGLADRWQADSFANAIYAAQSQDFIVVLQPASDNLTNMAGGYVLASGVMTPSVGGDSYQVDDVISLPGADGDTAGTARVQVVDVNGAILLAIMVTGGHYAAKPSGTIYPTGGHGGSSAFDATDLFVVGAPKARYLIQFKSHLLTAYTDDADGPDLQAVAGSGLATQGAGLADWNYGNPASDADFREIVEGGGPIMGLIRAGNFALVQKPTTGVLLSYIGLPNVYNEQELPQRVGQLAAYLMADCGEAGVVFISPKSIHAMDPGGNLAVIGDEVYRWWLGDMDANSLGNFYGAALQLRWECLFGYNSLYGPTQGPINRALVWDWLNKAWTTRDWPFTAAGVGTIPTAPIGQITKKWADMQQAWVTGPKLGVFCGDEAGNVYLHGRGDLTGGGRALTATLESGLSDLRDVTRKKLVRDIVVRAGNITGDPLLVQVGATNDPATAPVWGVPRPVPASGRYNVSAVGRFVKVRFTKTGGTFEMAGYDVVYQYGGKF